MPRRLSPLQLRRSACFRRLTGVSVATFDRMVAQLQAPWEAAERRKAKSGRPWEVGGLEDHLVIMLLYYRCYVTQEFIGVFWQVDRSVICRAIRRIEGHAQPLFGVKRDPKITRREAEALIVDCTEQPIQRLGADAVQWVHYSGRRKRHTLKTEYVVTAEGRIASVSDSHPGSRHDLTIRREGAKLPRSARVYADSAYQGLEREHPMVEVPYKKRKGGALSVEEKAYNRGLGSFRVAIEHRIGRTERLRIVAERYCNPRHTHPTKTSIIAGRVNIEAGFGIVCTAQRYLLDPPRQARQDEQVFRTNILNYRRFLNKTVFVIVISSIKPQNRFSLR